MERVMIQMNALATPENYDEAGYLANNPDVKGYLPSPYEHLINHGLAEGRTLRLSKDIVAIKAAKIEKIRRVIRRGLPHSIADGPSGPALCFLDDELKARYGVEDTDNVSAHDYDPNIVTLIDEYKDGLLLDCGAGKRGVYYENVVNYEIVNYDSTDVIGVAEELPFKDNAFDAVISVAVLEHVRDPFRAAKEIARVLKPGGKLFCCVPFLQAFHGYPNHYYNMTHVGLANLFPELRVLQQSVYPSTGPIHTLVWFFRNWLSGLQGQTKEDFLNMRVRDLIDDPWSYVDMPFVTEVPEAINFVIASATILIAAKEAGAQPGANRRPGWWKSPGHWWTSRPLKKGA
jgi:SAM-dependent methyltransferase